MKTIVKTVVGIALIWFACHLLGLSYGYLSLKESFSILLITIAGVLIAP